MYGMIELWAIRGASVLLSQQGFPQNEGFPTTTGPSLDQEDQEVGGWDGSAKIDVEG